MSGVWQGIWKEADTEKSYVKVSIAKKQAKIRKEHLQNTHVHCI